MGSNNRYDGLDEYAVKLIKHKARQLVGRAGFVDADRHDLEQDMVIDLLRRLPRFDPTLASASAPVRSTPDSTTPNSQEAPTPKARR